MYANGVGVDQNNDTAKQYFQAAADAGNPSGQFGLGYMYLTGQTVEQDHRTAFKLFQHASEAVSVCLLSCCCPPSACVLLQATTVWQYRMLPSADRC